MVSLTTFNNKFEYKFWKTTDKNPPHPQKIKEKKTKQNNPLPKKQRNKKKPKTNKQTNNPHRTSPQKHRFSPVYRSADKTVHESKSTNLMIESVTFSLYILPIETIWMF
jgi:hypothetical protein